MIRGANCQTSRDSFPGATIEHFEPVCKPLGEGDIVREVGRLQKNEGDWTDCGHCEEPLILDGGSREDGDGLGSGSLLSCGLITSDLPLHRTHALKVTKDPRNPYDQIAPTLLQLSIIVERNGHENNPD